MKKTYAFIAITLIVIGMFFANITQGQVYFTINLDTVPQPPPTVYYGVCPSNYDYLVLIAPTGATNPQWVPGNIYNDSLILPNTYQGEIKLFYDQGIRFLHIDSVALPTEPIFADSSVCGLTTINLDAENYPPMGYTHYLWSTGAITQTANVGVGTYTVTVSNACGFVTHTATISSNTPNPANIGPDKATCLNSPISLTSNNTNVVAYMWSTTETTSSITVSQPGDYAVTTTDNTGCISADTMYLTVRAPYNQQELCMAGVDTITFKNELGWAQHLNEGIDSIEIQKEISLNVWQTIGIVPNTVDTFLDLGSTPQTNGASYRILVVDSCGNRSQPSKYHTTITLITSYTPGPNVMGFSWSHYMINDTLVAPTYTIYGVDPIGTIHTITTVPGNLNYYNWNTPNLSYISFFVGFTLNCGAKVNHLVRSNYTGNPAGIHENPLNDVIKVYPTPTSGPITIMTELIIQDIRLYNELGQEFLIPKEKTFNIPYHGLFFLHITTNKGILVKQIIIQ
ncbi:MAG: hypothetical protein NTX91_04305 [candidate division SR1 bacterium]|nr:hypothetical protein [candidate division SR1 bacterium]